MAAKRVVWAEEGGGKGQKDEIVFSIHFSKF